MNIEIISGSARVQSLTKRVALHLHKNLEQTTNHHVGLIDIHDYNMPHVESVFSTPEQAPPKWRDIATRMFNADAFILVSPEYNGSYSPALKNFLDHFPKQDHKVFGIVTASPGSLGGIRAALQLQSLVFALFGLGSPRMLVIPEVDKKFSQDGELIEKTFVKAVDSFTNEFLWLAHTIYQAQVPAQASLVA